MTRRRRKWLRERLAAIANYESKYGEIKEHEFNTVALIGPTGCGKTLAMTWIGNNFALRGMSTFSNFHTTFSQFTEDPAALMTAPGILLIDEIQKYVNSRMSGNSKTLFYTELTSESRKTSGSLYCSSQRFMNIDIKVRNNVDYVLFPDYQKDLHWCTVYAFEGLEYEKPLDIFEFDCIPIYKMFETKERVKSVYDRSDSDNFDTMLARLSPEELSELSRVAMQKRMQGEAPDIDIPRIQR